MSLSNPRPIAPKSSGFKSEVSTATSFADAYQFLQPKKIKVSKNSPPNVTDVGELEHVFDKTTQKLWTKIDGVLYSTQYS